MVLSKEVVDILQGAHKNAESNGFEYITAESLLFEMTLNDTFRKAFEECDGDIRVLGKDLTEYMRDYIDRSDGKHKPEYSKSAVQALAYAQFQVENSGRKEMRMRHLLSGIWSLDECYAVYYMQLQEIDEVDLLRSIARIEDEEEYGEELRDKETDDEEYPDEELYPDDDETGGFRDDGAVRGMREKREKQKGQKEDKKADKNWQLFAPCLNDTLKDVNPLIGREAELERTIQILCRKDKNNPLHIGEPGVGKTAITYGLVQRIREGKVPEPLIGCRVFALDLSGMLAGTQYRGDFEKRFKKVLTEIGKEEKPIIYLDEIHNINRAGAVEGGSLDAGNMLKPYLSDGHIRFIGATTFEEYKKSFEKSKSLVRRFQNVEIREPSIDETVDILNGLKAGYEAFHGVIYEDGLIDYAVNMSAKYINERFLPDKAIDLIDEAGAYRKLHPIDGEVQSVGRDVVNEVLTKICRVPIETVETDELTGLATLEERIKARVFGQDEAVAQVVNAIKFSKAGLLEENKPLASLLFVGPTGVGKTEIAKTLAKELGVKLVRFDMSEYGEKHAVAKLIGAPAGYVGYEEGGLLTEEIRKNPSSVLLLDEIEKAHADIYNVLLQMMDYATLTDNQGRKADFRNVVIIMTSNAGANRLGKPSIGFKSGYADNTVIEEEVKHTFQPEFRNRLNRIVMFNGMDEAMGLMVVDKKLSELSVMLEKKDIELSVSDEARALLMKKGISREYGAREVDRVIRNEIKPLLVDDILFGGLKNGGKLILSENGGEFCVNL